MKISIDVKSQPIEHRYDKWLTNDTFCRIRLSTDGCDPKQPYFSVTVDGRDFGGCCHDIVLKMRPDLQPLVNLHLSDLDGAPMHAFENAVYWLSGAMPELPGFRWKPSDKDSPPHSPGDCKRILGQHLRTDPESLIAAVRTGLAATLRIYERRLIPANLVVQGVRAIVQAHVDALRPQWKAEAEAGLKLIASLQESQ